MVYFFYDCRVHYPESYFITELIYAPLEELQDQKTINFSVITLPCLNTPNDEEVNVSVVKENQGEGDQPTNKRRKVCDKTVDDQTQESALVLADQLRELMERGGHTEQSFILDIDLDFFSTQNPFRGKQHDLLRQLYFRKLPALTDEKVSL